MNGLAGRPRTADGAILWFASVLALSAGCYAAFGPLAAGIAERHELTARVSTAIRTNAETIAQRPELMSEQRAVDERLRGFDLHADRAALVARFVQSAARIAANQRVDLEQVEARGTPAIATASPTETTPQTSATLAFEAIPLEVTLRGDYNALLATVRELADAPLPLRIEIAAIERSAPAPDGAAADGPLTARLHLVLERLTDDAADAPALHAIQEDTTTHARSH